jgi:amino acid adenylation domain-containing protein
MSPEPQLRRVSRDQSLPLSADQYRIWFLHQLTPGLITFNINFAYRIDGALDVELFEQSLNAVVERHESLRTTFELRGEQPEQVIHPASRIDVPVHDLSALAPEAGEADARAQMEVASVRPFSLDTGPLLRCQLFVLRPQLHLLLFTIHHIVADYDSLKLITRDLFHFYNKQRHPELPSLPPLTVQYADYAHWQDARIAAGEFQKQLEYWKEQLGGEIPVLKMPMDRPRHTVATHRGAIESITIGPELTQQLQRLSKDNSVTLFVTLYSAYQVLLQRYTGQLDINIGTPITTRNRPELLNLVGLFINTLVLKSDLGGDPTFPELLKRNRKIAYAAFARQEIPYEQLVDKLKPQRNLSHNLFFQTMVMLLDAERSGDSLVSDLQIEPFELKKQTTTFELTVTFGVRHSDIQITLDFNTDLYNPDTARQLLRRLHVLLGDIVRDPSRQISDFSILPPEELTLLRERFARGPLAPASLEYTVAEMFSAQAARTPDKVALRFRDDALSYGELDAQSNQLATWLIRQGVEPGALVGIVTHRSLEALVAIVAILKAGGAYVPIDPSHPMERIEGMIQNSRARIVLASSEVQSLLDLPDAHVFALEELLPALAAEPALQPDVITSADDVMYVIYTSGSTGEPKGVMVTHRSVVNHCAYVIKRFRLSPEDNVLQFTSLGFDVSVQEIFPTLLHGATLVLWKDRHLEETGEFMAWAAEQRLSVVNLTTAHWNRIVADLGQSPIAVPGTLKLVIVGGEKVSSDNWLAWDRLTAGKVRFINDYGLTETTITATMFEPSPGFVPEGAFPVGTPIDNVEVYVLDPKRSWLPPGVFGDLYVGGVCVAKGYLGLPELTAERFLPNPFAAGMMFKTGDRARFRSDGTLEFEGRADDQVKIRGHRVELEEVEAHVRRAPGVQKSVVVARDTGNGALALVAYLVVQPDAFSIAALKGALKKSLPDYMVPQDYVLLQSIPLTAHGKVDKARLPPPTSSATPPEETFVAPVSEMELAVAACWGQAIKRHPISARSNFFEIGGDSLLATVVISQLKATIKVNVPLRLLFEHPILTDFASQLEAVLAGSASASDACMVKLRQTGTQRPLFYVHPVGGTVSCYFSLARQLGPEQPFYALQSHALICRNSPYDTVEKMAAYYLTEIRQIQAHGPYRLGGWSLGGFIAYEIARLLLEQGEEVEQLSMIDTYLTKARVADDQTILFNFVLQLAAVPGKHVPAEAIMAWEGKLHSHGEVCEQLRALGLVPMETSNEDIQRLLEVYTYTVHAFKKYDPKPDTKLALKNVILFRAQDSHEERGVWSTLVDDLTIHHVDADHFSIPHHEKVGAVLRQS